MTLPLSSRILWRIAKFLYWLDRHWWKPASLGNSIVDFMETRGVCCERHAKGEVSA